MPKGSMPGNWGIDYRDRIIGSRCFWARRRSGPRSGTPLRKHGQGDIGQMSIEELIVKLGEEVESKK